MCTQQYRCATKLTSKHMSKYAEIASAYAEFAAQKAALLQRAAEIDAKVEAERIAEKADAIAAIQAQMTTHGVTLQDLGAPALKAARRARTPKAQRPAGDGTHPTKGKKVPIKYRGLDSKGQPAAWSGRGLKPRWLQDAIEAGASIEQFEVAA